MKKTLGSKIIGRVLITFSILGILFSLSGIITLWVLRPSFRNSGSELLLTLEDALDTSQEGFILMDQVIENLLMDFDIIDESFENLEKTLEGVSGSLEISSNLIGNDLKQTVIDTQTALNSAASTAELIDNTLNFLSRISFGRVDYDPDVPLHISFNQIADSLDKFPTALETVEGGITKTTSGLDSLQINLTDLSDQIQEFNDDLENAQVVLSKFNDSIDVMINRVKSFNNNLGTYLTIACLFISGMLFWMGFSQIAVLNQGYIYLKGGTNVVNLSDIQRK